MYAIEFEAQITNGHIVIPTELGMNLRGPVRVILLQEEVTDDAASLIASDLEKNIQSNAEAGENEEDDFLTYRIKHPYQIPDFKPLTRDQVYERRPDYE